MEFNSACNELPKTLYVIASLTFLSGLTRATTDKRDYWRKAIIHSNISLIWRFLITILATIDTQGRADRKRIVTSEKNSFNPLNAGISRFLISDENASSQSATVFDIFLKLYFSCFVHLSVKDFSVILAAKILGNSSFCREFFPLQSYRPRSFIFTSVAPNQDIQLTLRPCFYILPAQQVYNTIHSRFLKNRILVSCQGAQQGLRVYPLVFPEKVFSKFSFLYTSYG